MDETPTRSSGFQQLERATGILERPEGGPLRTATVSGGTRLDLTGMDSLAAGSGRDTGMGHSVRNRPSESREPWLRRFQTCPGPAAVSPVSKGVAIPLRSVS